MFLEELSSSEIVRINQRKVVVRNGRQGVLRKVTIFTNV